MHSSDFGDYTVHHNGDFSGDVIIELSPDEIGPMEERLDGSTAVRLPFALLKSIVAAWVRGSLVERLEDMSDDKLLTRREEG